MAAVEKYIKTAVSSHDNQEMKKDFWGTQLQKSLL